MTLAAALVAALTRSVLVEPASTSASASDCCSTPRPPVRELVFGEFHSQPVACRCGDSSAAAVAPLGRLGVARVVVLDEAEAFSDGDFSQRAVAREEILQVIGARGVSDAANVQPSTAGHRDDTRARPLAAEELSWCERATTARKEFALCRSTRVDASTAAVAVEAVSE